MTIAPAVIPYLKPFTTIAEQIERLEKRGMVIDNRKTAELWLKRVGYYRLSGYWYELREQDDSAPDGSRKDTFKPGSALSEVIELYRFDERLRLLILKAICPIEVALRAHIVRVLGRKNPRAYLDVSLFQDKFTQPPKKGRVKSAYDHWLGKIASSVEQSKKEQFIEHFFQKYCTQNGPDKWKIMPLWIMADCWNFGLLSKCCSGLDMSYCARIAKNFVISGPLLISWIYTLNTARNCAAHHSRLWNRWWNAATPKMPPKNALNGLFSHIVEIFKTNSHIQVSTYMVLAIIKYFLLWTVEDRGRGWGAEVRELLGQLPRVFGGPGKLGFPENWEGETLWNFRVGAALSPTRRPGALPIP